MTKRIFALATICLLSNVGLAQPPGRRADSPASSQIPAAESEQSYSEDLIAAGRTIFASQCGFCHGREATGGAGGSDLTRSDIVAADVRGDRIGPFIRGGRPDAGMPAFPGIAADDLAGIVAFVHSQRDRAATLEGGRQSVTTDDLLSGDVRAGQRYFERECTECHSANGDLRGIASRMEGLRLLQRMLYPRPGNFGQSGLRSVPTVTVRTADGETVVGELDYEDEFNVALIDAQGRHRSFSTRTIDYDVDNPLDGHIELLDRYTDQDMHDLITYLHTLR
jgi:cytochrome c oxidase cbb3-type subunit 3